MMPGEQVFLTMEYVPDESGEMVLADVRERRLCLVIGMESRETSEPESGGEHEQ